MSNFYELLLQDEPLIPALPVFRTYYRDSKDTLHRIDVAKSEDNIYTEKGAIAEVASSLLLDGTDHKLPILVSITGGKN